jgi:hypothetical protein
MRMYQITQFIPILKEIFIWSLKRLIFLIILSIFAAWAGNPHGPLGGYFVILGLVFLFPFHAVHSIMGPFNGLGIWIFAILMQLIFLMLVLMVLRTAFLFLKRLMNRT